MEFDEDDNQEIGRALETLSVSINGLMTDYCDLAASPPKADEGYLELAGVLGGVGADIVVLAKAMEVLVRRFPAGAR